MKIRIIVALAVCVLAVSVVAGPKAPHADPIGQPESPAMQRNESSDAEAWPAVSQHQERHPLAARPDACGGEPCQNDPGPVSSGGSEYGLCKSNKACSIIEYGMCYSKPFGKCQDKTSGDGNPCRGC